MTISRNHAVIHRSTITTYEINNHSEENLLLINRKQVKNHILQTNDTIQLGRFFLYFYGDEVLYGTTAFEGTCLLEIPLYVPMEDDEDQQPESDYGDTFNNAKVQRWLKNTAHKSTFNLSPQEARKLLQQNTRMKQSEIFTTDMQQSWKPGAEGIGFGEESQIPIKSWFNSAEVAQIQWSVDTHSIVRCTKMVTIRVNGKHVASNQDLESGDKIQVGSSHFVYVVTE